MKRIITILIICFFAASIFAQSNAPAPDFTITTSDGVQRKLYEDYLDKGKAVVLYIFFITCPICQEMAPLLEPFYYEWAKGQASVEFISLSTQANDSNSDVKWYKGVVGHSFPGAGNDGGSLTAIKPYTNGTYGFFAGTPTFVVIGPDRQVIYNPKGESFIATIDSIDQALRRTGVEKPAVPFHLTGKIMLPDSSGVSGIKVQIKNVEHDSAATDSTGQFNFTASLVARNNAFFRFEDNTDYTRGISTYDVVKIQRHVLGIETFTSPYELLAADVDRSGAITIADIIQLRRIILHVDVKFPKNNSWLFLNSNYTFSDPESPFFEAYTGEAASFPFVPVKKEMQPFSVIAIKIGDVNFSAR